MKSLKRLSSVCITVYIPLALLIPRGILSVVGRVSKKVWKVRRARVEKILSEVAYVLKKNPKLLDDGDVRRWLLMIFSIAVVYGDPGVKEFFRSLYAKLLEQPH